MQTGNPFKKKGYGKLLAFRKQAAREQLRWGWMDTCW